MSDINYLYKYLKYKYKYITLQNKLYLGGKKKKKKTGEKESKTDMEDHASWKTSASNKMRKIAFTHPSQISAEAIAVAEAAVASEATAAADLCAWAGNAVAGGRFAAPPRLLHSAKTRALVTHFHFWDD